MGKKVKTNTKAHKPPAKLHPPESSAYALPELSLEQFEKSLTAMLETLNNKRIEFMKATALDTPSPNTTDLPKTPEKSIEAQKYHQEKHSKSFHEKESQWNKQKHILIDESTASCGSIDSSHTFMVPRSSHKIKELVFKRSTNGQNRGLNKTPLTCINKTWNSDYKTPNSVAKNNLRSLQGKKSNSDVRTLTSGDNECILSTNASELMTNSGLYELSYSCVKQKEIPVKVKSFSDLVERRPDMYLRGRKYYLLGDISLEDILHRIYFERCSYDDLKEYIPLALQSVPDLETFLDILYTSIRDFALRARDYILTRLLDIVIKVKRVIKTQNGDLQVVHEFGGYKRFGKHTRVYIGLIKRIYEACKSLEAVSSEAERVCWTYLRYFLQEERRFCCAEFHRQIFVKYFYGEPLIKDFLYSITKYFEGRRFYALTYPTAAHQLQELKEFFDKWQCESTKQTCDDEDRTNVSVGYSIEDDDQVQLIQKEPRELVDKDEHCIVRDLHKEYKTMDNLNDDLKEKENGVLKEHNPAENKAKPAQNNKHKKKKKTNKKNKNNSNKENLQNESNLNTKMQEKNNAEDLEKMLNQDDEEWEGLSKFDSEIEEFEKKLEQDKKPKSAQKKIKPNISDDWLEGLRQKLQKRKSQPI